MEEQHIEHIDGVAYVWGSIAHERAIDAKIKDTYDRLMQSSDLQLRTDSVQTAFIAKDLVYVSRDVQRMLYERLRMTEFVTVRAETPRGAHATEYRMLHMSGEEARPRSLDADDAPTADIGIENFEQPVVDIPGSYTYTIKELEAAAFTGTPLSRDKAEACAFMLARGIDRVLREGDEEAGITGFLNDPNVPVVTLSNGAWLTATEDDIIADVRQALSAIVIQSLDNHEGKRMLLPVEYNGRLEEPRPNTDTSIKNWIQNNTTLERIDRYMALDTAIGPSGVTDPPFGVVYDPDPSNVYADVPIPYEELAPQARNFGWVVNARALVAGIKWKRPLSAVYIENLD